MVRVAYWDTEQGANPPAALGQISGTPTIKAFVPDRRKLKGGMKGMDYSGAREVTALASFAASHMPNFIESVRSPQHLQQLHQKARDFGLPQMLVFSKSADTTTLLKALSTEHRRRLLVAEVPKIAATKQIAADYGVSEWPAVVALSSEGRDPVWFNKSATYHKLNNFFGKFALKAPVKGKTAAVKVKDEM